MTHSSPKRFLSFDSKDMFSFRILRQPRSRKTKAAYFCPFPTPRCTSSDVSVKPGITTGSRTAKSLCLGEEYYRGQAGYMCCNGGNG